jgi:NADH-quinone oxidoreductase subunit A
MLHEYLPILIFLIFALALSMAIIVGSSTVAKILKTRQTNTMLKESPYECGFQAFGDARMPFDVKFYLVAILFIVFDLEVAFLFPWAVALRQLSWMGVITMGVFLLILVVGFIYEWKKGALEWE